MVLTCFEELMNDKGIVPMRGDLISHLDEDEGKTLMETLMDYYMIEEKYQKVAKFNFDSDNFQY